MLKITTVLALMASLTGCVTVQNYADPAVRVQYNLKLTETDKRGIAYLKGLQRRSPAKRHHRYRM